MSWLQGALDTLGSFVTLGGPVVAILLAMSVLSFGIVIFKLAQFRALGVGRRNGLNQALDHWDAGRPKEAKARITQSRSHIRHVMTEAMEGTEARRTDPTRLSERLLARTEEQMSRLDSGFRALDIIAQLAPLLGLFGTVLGMIEAFQNLQGAGASVDPSILAGGIWVALMTTAVGLAVAMPTSLLLTWLEARVAGERVFADKALQMLLCPREQARAEVIPHAAA
jgi:biopolymer transport protein ExbB